MNKKLEGIVDFINILCWISAICLIIFSIIGIWNALEKSDKRGKIQESAHAFYASPMIEQPDHFAVSVFHPHTNGWLIPFMINQARIANKKKVEVPAKTQPLVQDEWRTEETCTFDTEGKTCEI